HLQPTPLQQLPIQAVMRQPVVSLSEHQLTDVTGIFQLFEQHPIHHLPIVDESDRPVGILTQEALAALVKQAALQVPPMPPLAAALNPSASASVKLAPMLDDYERLYGALQERERDFAILVSNVPGAVYRCTHTDEWHGMYVSDGITTIVGYPATDFWAGGSRSFSSIIAPEDREPTDRLVEQAIQQRQPFAIEYRLIHADGSVRWVLDKGIGVYDDHDQLRWVDGIIIDISDRKATELALRQTESQSNAVIAAIPDMLCRVGADGVYRQVMTHNRAIDILPPDYNPVGQWMHDFLPPDLAQRQQWALEQALQTGELLVYEQTVQVGDRSQDEEVRVIKCGDDEVLVMVRDITARKQTENALKQSEQTNRAIINAIPDLLIRMDRAGKYHGILAGTSMQVKLPSKIVDQPTVYDVMPPDQAERRLAYAHRALETGTMQVYEQLFDVDGTLQDEEVRIAPLNDQEVLVIIRDVSDRKQAERELQTLNQTLEAKVAERTALLQASEAHNRAIIAAMPDLLLRVKRDGTCLEYIPPAQKVEWCARIEHHLSEALPPDSLARELAAIAQALDTGELQIYELEYTQDNRHDFEEVRVIPIAADEALLIVRDVGDRKQSEAELLASQEQLLRSHLDLANSVASLQRSNALLTAQREASFDGILVIDEHRQIATYNQRFLDLW
ncbi:MAG TPA: PAS domain S-box protein, partial [Chroococcidiopsis sp.]